MLLIEASCIFIKIYRVIIVKAQPSYQYIKRIIIFNVNQPTIKAKLIFVYFEIVY